MSTDCKGDTDKCPYEWVKNPKSCHSFKRCQEDLGISMTHDGICPCCKGKTVYYSREQWKYDYRIAKCPHCQEPLLLLDLPFPAFGAFGPSMIPFEWVKPYLKQMDTAWKMYKDLGIFQEIEKRTEGEG